MNKRLISIYKSRRKNEMYLYLPRNESFESLPDALKQLFGQCEHVMDLLLTPERTLARADTETVISDLESKGYYLQMPPAEPEVECMQVTR